MEFLIEHHAALYGYFARAAIVAAGEEGRRAMAEATCLYGQQRGRRMALRAVRDGAPLDMNSYLLYGEWADKEGKNISQPLSVSPHYTTATTHCGWCEAWEKLGLLEYAKLYCQYVDENLVRGFDPALHLGIEGVLSAGADHCHFIWYGADLSGKAMADFARRKTQMGEQNQRDFLYHTAHLYRALTDTLRTQLPQYADSVIATAEQVFAGQYGPAALAAVQTAASQDFSAI